MVAWCSTFPEMRSFHFLAHSTFSFEYYRIIAKWVWINDWPQPNIYALLYSDRGIPLPCWTCSVLQDPREGHRIIVWRMPTNFGGGSTCEARNRSGNFGTGVRGLYKSGAFGGIRRITHFSRPDLPIQRNGFRSRSNSSTCGCDPNPRRGL